MSQSGVKRPYKLLDRTRTIKKGVAAASLAELVALARQKLNIGQDKEDVYVVLEEDGTEVDDEDYFGTLPDNTTLMLLLAGDQWSPFGISDDATDNGAVAGTRLANLLCRLESDPGTIALMEGADLELIAEMDCEQMLDRFPRFSNAFLANLQTAADRHLLEKSEIRDTLGLLKLYHSAQRGGALGQQRQQQPCDDQQSDGVSVPKRRRKAEGD